MRQGTAMNDSKQPAKSEAKASATRRFEPRSQDASPSPELVACSSITLPINSQREGKANGNDDNWDHLSGVTSIDWFQLAACVVWDGLKSKHWFERLRIEKLAAQESRHPAIVQMGPDIVNVSPGGQGGGNDSHKEIQLEWKGVQVGLSERDNATRQLSNATMTATGNPCLVTGWTEAWMLFRRVIEFMGGTAVDEWIRRNDFCIDLPGLDFATDLYPLLQKRHLITRCRGRNYNEEGVRPTGFSVGKCNRLRVVIYDKRYETNKKLDPVYLEAMRQRRWAGVIPETATRVEWQIGRPWLRQFSLENSESFLERMPDLFAKLTDEVQGSFRITKTEPDRKNQHQSRAETLPLWKRIVEIGKETMGQSTQPLTRLDRSNLDERRAIHQILGFATSIADRRGSMCGTKSDVKQLISEMLDRHEIGDAQITESFERKAKKSGTWQDLLSFPGKEVA